MRLLRTISSFITLLILSAGCNDDVFIERLEASQTEFALPMTGGTVKVQLSHGDWRLDRVEANHIDCRGWVRDEDSEEQYSVISLKRLGSARHESNFYQFVLERSDRNSLEMTVGQSMNTEETLFELYLTNDYEEVVVTVTMEPCGGYVFDRIEYGDVTYVSPEGMVEEGWKVVVNNATDSPLVQEWEVFNENACRTINFPANTIKSSDIPYVWYDTLMEYLKEPFSVPVPEPFLARGNISLAGLTVPFTVRGMNLPVDLPDDRVMAVLEPGERTLTVYWGYDQYSVDYTIWLKHDDGGKPLSFSGSLTSKTCNGYWVKLIRE